MLPIFTYQKLLGRIDGTSSSPSPTITVEGTTQPNPEALAWTEVDQRAIILLQSSLTEEVAAEVLGLTTARQIWLSLEAAYSNASVERIHSLRDVTPPFLHIAAEANLGTSLDVLDQTLDSIDG
ncbi:hypothetical protein Tco_0683213 [Tanacetum coccineum]|uniref:Uncharacterized protein n=1 Tax=Tanacetum coccineum TaxID=301880 RepID=A0ABQ4XUT1_9ASTR